VPRDFIAGWLNLSRIGSAPKDPKTYPEFDDSLRAAMMDEAQSFFATVVQQGDARFRPLSL
jgi:hypothetical protein